VCGVIDPECSSGLFCDGGKCAYKFGTRKIGETCNRPQQCKGHSSTGTHCCKGKCVQKLKDNANIHYCPFECRGKSSKPGITPLGSCHLSNGSKRKTISPKLANGKMCLENDHCKSNWCHAWKCKKRYGYDDKGYVCASNQECADGLFCDGGKCAFKFSTRKINQTCNRGEQCKNHNILTGAGTQCCAKGSNPKKRGALPPFSVGQCTQKKKDWIGAHYCPGEVIFGAGEVPLGEKCNLGTDCLGRNILTGKGNNCCLKDPFNKKSGKVCTKKVKDWAGAYYCPEDCRGAAAAPLGTCHLKGWKGKKCKI
jgi:hypothetical protein